MLGQMRQNWQKLKESEPGSRFQDRYHRSQGSEHSRWNLSRLITLVVGVAIILVGLFAVAFPTPLGWVLVLVGLVVIAGEIKPVARFIDWAEVKARKLGWRARDTWRSSVAGKVVLIVVALATTALVGYGAHYLLFGS